MKRTLSDLAIFGGNPLFGETLHTGRPNLGDTGAFLDRVRGVLDRRWLTNNGPLVVEFERRVAELAGVEHCVAMCNATIGLQVAVRALGLTGEVLVPSFTYPATPHVLGWTGAMPVLCDVDPVTGNLDPAAVERAITPRTTGILAVHVWGRPCFPRELEEVAERHGLALLFDAAHAFGVVADGVPVGGFGAAEVFSFHATKFVNSVEGGALVTGDAELADRARSLRNFGFVGEDVAAVGTNAKMNELCAAMGLTSLDSLDALLRDNRANHAAYRAGLRDVRGMTLHEYPADVRANHQFVVAEVAERASGIGRDALMRVLEAENVITRAHFSPGCHRMAPYSATADPAGFPHTEALAARVITLPTGNAIGAPEIEALCGLLDFVTRNGAGVARRLESPVPA